VGRKLQGGRIEELPVRIWKVAAFNLLLLAAAAGAGERSAPRPPCWYTVRSGDTLARISRRFYGKTELWQRIKRANPGLDERRLEVGTRIYIPAARGPLRPPAKGEPAEPEEPLKLAPGPETPGLEDKFALAAMGLAHVISALVALPLSFLLECFLLYLAARLLRRHLFLRDTSFKRAARGTLLSMLFGGLAAAAVIGVLFLALYWAMDNPAAVAVWSILSVLLGAVAWIYVNCKVLARNYGVSTGAGAVIFIVREVLGAVIGCGLALIVWLIMFLILGVGLSLSG